MPFCYNCGTELSSGVKKCSNCGRKYENSDNSAKIAFGIIGSIFGFAFLVYLLGRPAASNIETNSQENTSRYAIENQRVGTDEPESPLPVVVDDNYAKSSYTSLCADRYPSDFSMRAACSRNAQSGRSDFIDIWNRYLSNGSMNIALQNCYQRYTKEGSTDFAMLGACARNQESGFKDIN